MTAKTCLVSTLQLGTIIAILLTIGSPASAQRGVGARGGSITRERIKEEPAPTPALITTTSTESKKEGCPEPTPDPEPTPTPFCDRDTIGTCPWSYTFTYAFNAASRPRHSAGTAAVMGAGFSFFTYVTPRVFFEIDNDNVISQKEQNVDRVTGVGDTTLIVGGDLLVEDEEGPQPGISLLYGIKLPSASQSKGLGSGEIDHLLLGSMGKSFGLDSRNFLGVDAGVYFAGKGSGEYYKIPIATLSFERVLTCSRKFTLHTEIGGSFRTEDVNAEISNLTFLKVKLSDRAQWRIGGKFGITPNSPSVGIYTAIRFSGNLKEIF